MPRGALRRRAAAAWPSSHPSPAAGPRRARPRRVSRYASPAAHALIPCTPVSRPRTPRPAAGRIRVPTIDSDETWNPRKSEDRTQRARIWCGPDPRPDLHADRVGDLPPAPAPAHGMRRSGPRSARLRSLC